METSPASRSQDVAIEQGGGGDVRAREGVEPGQANDQQGDGDKYAEEREEERFTEELADEGLSAGADDFADTHFLCPL